MPRRFAAAAHPVRHDKEKEEVGCFFVGFFAGRGQSDGFCGRELTDELALSLPGHQRVDPSEWYAEFIDCTVHSARRLFRETTLLALCSCSFPSFDCWHVLCALDKVQSTV